VTSSLCIVSQYILSLLVYGQYLENSKVLSDFSDSAKDPPTEQKFEARGVANFGAWCTCILPILLYGVETWSVTLILSRKIDALDSWCLRRILNVHWSEFVTSDEIRSRTGQPFLSDTVCSRRLSFFLHLHHADHSQDHYRALQACIMGPSDDWRRRIGHPRQSWLRTVEADLQPMNLGLATPKWHAQDRSRWWKLVTTATSSTSS